MAERLGDFLKSFRVSQFVGNVREPKYSTKWVRWMRCCVCCDTIYLGVILLASAGFYWVESAGFQDIDAAADKGGPLQQGAVVHLTMLRFSYLGYSKTREQQTCCMNVRRAADMLHAA